MAADGSVTETVTVKRKTFKRDWAAYNEAQTSEGSTSSDFCGRRATASRSRRAHPLAGVRQSCGVMRPSRRS